MWKHMTGREKNWIKSSQSEQKNFLFFLDEDLLIFVYSLNKSFRFFRTYSIWKSSEMEVLARINHKFYQKGI